MEEESYTATHPVDHNGPVTGSFYSYLLFHTRGVSLQKLRDELCQKLKFKFEISKY
jgi:hypothetical protein